MSAFDEVMKRVENMSEDMKLGLITGLVIGLTLALTVMLLSGQFRGGGSKRVNNKIEMTCPKVVNKVPTADIEDTGVFCRCWKSSTFPLCDGTHAKQ